jgi:D-2-hydroxyacid dehydrogenase (NADP+)
MKEVNLLITYKSEDPYAQHPLEDEYLQKIRGVSDRIKILVTDLSRSDKGEDTAASRELGSFLSKVDVIFGHRLPRNLFARAPKLKWLQAMSAGVDMLMNDELKRSSIVLTNMRGISAVPVAESAFALILALAKSLHICFEQKQQRLWKQFHPEILDSSTLGILGLGNIGRQAARIAKSFGMRVIATNYVVSSSRKVRNVDLVLKPDGLKRVLAECDYAVICLPLTTETRGLIGEGELRAMKSTACLINVSRGSIIDEPALIKALKEKWISAAALDVFSREPLPPDSELWQIPNLIITPHVSGYLGDHNRRATEFFCNNLKRYLQGKRLLNIVNKKKEF